MEVLEASASVEKVVDQAVQTVDETAHDTVDERTGAEPVLMDMDEVRTGVEPVLETVEKKLGEQAVRTGDEPVPEVEELRIGKELVPADVEMGTRDIPVHGIGEGDSYFENYPGDDFEKVGEYTPEETSQSPSTPAPEKPV